MSGSRGVGSRGVARRMVLSALAGGGLTAASLGGPLTGGALGAEAPAGSTTTGEGAAPPAASTTPEMGTPTTGSGESTTSTQTTPASTTPSTTSSPATVPATPLAPATGQPSAAEAPVVIVRHKQRPTPSRPAARNLSQTKAKSTGGQSAAGGQTPGKAGASAPAGGPNDVALAPQLVAGQAGALAAMLGGSAASAQALDFYRIPLFLLPIYRAAAIQYDVPWPILAAINEIETDYGADLSVSTAGAEGWMQFEPATWLQYGVDALNAGYADPYNPVDAIFAAARYLHAAGASSDLRTAILAYNHSEEYASSVLLRAKLIATYPGAVIATLTGLVDGRPPVTGRRIGWDAPTPTPTTASPPLSSASATAGASAVPAPQGSPSAASGSTAAAATAEQSASAASAPGASAAPSPASAATAATAVAPLQLVDVTSVPDAKVVAVQDGRVVRLGSSRKLGRYLILQDVYGDVFTYAGLGSIAPTYVPPKQPAASGGASAQGAPVSSAATAKQTREPAPTQAASAGAQLPLTLKVKASAGGAASDAAPAGASREVTPADSTESTPTSTGKVRVFAHPDGNPDALVAIKRAKASSASAAGGRRRLRSGSIVAEGTVLGRVRTPPGAKDGHLRFAIRPAGDPSTVDPRAILSNWTQLDAALHPQGAKGNPNLLGATASDVFLLSKGRLEREVLSDPDIALSACSRHEVAAGAIDKRALAVLAFLSRSGLKPTVGTLRCGDGAYAMSGYVTTGHSGDAIAITQINGVPIAGHQGSGSITDTTIRTLLTLQGEFVPARIVSLMRYPGAPTTLARADHGDYVEIAFTPAPARAVTPKSAAAHSAGAAPTTPAMPVAIVGELSTAQWEQLIARIAALPTPTIAVKPSSAAISDHPSSTSPSQAVSGNHGLGSGSSPSGG
jgi:membrane-bound lytic murein transglycosylase B